MAMAAPLLLEGGAAAGAGGAAAGAGSTAAAAGGVGRFGSFMNGAMKMVPFGGGGGGGEQKPQGPTQEENSAAANSTVNQIMHGSGR